MKKELTDALKLPVYEPNDRIIRKLETSKPTGPGMYLELCIPRDDPDDSQGDWNADPLYFGPLEYCHITFMSTMLIKGVGEDMDTGPLSMTISTSPNTGRFRDPMFVYDEFIYYDGKFYSDWSCNLF